MNLLVQLKYIISFSRDMEDNRLKEIKEGNFKGNRRLVEMLVIFSKIVPGRYKYIAQQINQIFLIL